MNERIRQGLSSLLFSALSDSCPATLMTSLLNITDHYGGLRTLSGFMFCFQRPRLKRYLEHDVIEHLIRIYPTLSIKIHHIRILNRTNVSLTMHDLGGKNFSLHPFKSDPSFVKLTCE